MENLQDTLVQGFSRPLPGLQWLHGVPVKELVHLVSTSSKGSLQLEASGQNALMIVETA